jgi:hypothetical protein
MSRDWTRSSLHFASLSFPLVPVKSVHPRKKTALRAGRSHTCVQWSSFLGFDIARIAVRVLVPFLCVLYRKYQNERFMGSPVCQFARFISEIT